MFVALLGSEKWCRHFLAGTPCVHHLLYVLLTLNSFFVRMISWRPIISGSTGLIFIKFSPCGRYMAVDYWLDLLFLVGQGTLPWQPILGSNLAKSADSPPFVVLAFLNGVGCRNYNFKRFIGENLASLCKTLVNFGPATPVLTRFKGIHPSLINSSSSFAWRHDC